jgi:hypothetical protein
MFHSCAPAPNNARSKEAQAPAKLKDEDYGEKKAHRGRIDWSPGKCIAFPQKKKPVKAFFNFCIPTCSFFIWNMIPGSLLPLFKCVQDYPER